MTKGFLLFSRHILIAGLYTASFFLCTNLIAQRVPVLAQIDVPHSYYFRELYLPQLTSGPSAVDWISNDQLLYSMHGSLWRQAIKQNIAEQLTDADGYDYQPDVSPDGTKVVFVRYNGISVELMLFDLINKQTFRLTDNKAVNLEPRWSPDGQSIVYVSTMKTGHFLVYRAEIKSGKLENIQCLTPDHQSVVKRYYYSSWDHGINPVWSSDGKGVFYVSNNEVPHGTGDLVYLNLKDGVVKKIQHEETNWRMRPDISPDGSRMVYSSYQGRGYHQLWLLPVEGGYPFPLTYGEFDNVNPRWSPDGGRIAFISNREGNTTLWTVDALEGKQEKIQPAEFKFLKPHQLLRLQFRDEAGKVIPARISITDLSGKFCAPVNSWIQADDALYPGQHRFEYHYFYSNGNTEVYVPMERLLISASHGPETEISKLNVDASKIINQPSVVTIKSFPVPADYGKWQSADLHVHMNYGGNYLNNPDNLLKQASAENLNYVFNLIVNKEQRIPDVSWFSEISRVSPDKKSMLFHAQEYHTSFWGHLGLLNLTDHFMLPDYSGYPYTAAASLFPDNTWVAARAREQKGLAGYVHPFEMSEVLPVIKPDMHHELPVSAALGLVDYYEVIGFADHRASEYIWHQLLNCGLKIPAGAGTDAMMNYSSLRGPIGLNRVYVPSDGTLNTESLLSNIRSGRSFVTNGPLLGFSVDGKNPGDEISISAGGAMLNYKAFLRSQVPLDYFEVVWNGEVIAKHTLIDTRRYADVSGKVKVKGPGWLLIRAGSNAAHPDLPDLYPFATTNPIWISVPGNPVYLSSKSGALFSGWVERLEKIVREFSEFRAESERKLILENIDLAQAFYKAVEVKGLK